MNVTERIKARAREIGFSKVGVTDASPLSEGIRNRFRAWIEKGYHGDLTYLERSEKKRMAPEGTLKGARSIISVALNYHPGMLTLPADRRRARISRYGLGRDYHEVVSKKLSTLLDFIVEHAAGPVHGKVFCDTGPVMEKAIAQRAGLGWIGKHGILLTQEFGSWIFLGEIIIDLPLSIDEPADDLCSSCTLCMQACPTSAIVSPGVVDIRRCISYQTVENRGVIPETLRRRLGNWIFGCDCCQEVCPYSKTAKPAVEQAFLPKPELVSAPMDMLYSVADREFDESFSDSAMVRATREGLLRNIVVAMGNSCQATFLPLLTRIGKEKSRLLSAHAAWAIETIKEGERIGGSRNQ